MFHKIRGVFLLVLVFLLVACAAVDDGTDTGEVTAPAATATATDVPEATATSEPATATVPPTEVASPTPPPPTPYDDTFWTADNIFNTILGPAPAPEGWQVQPCEGEAPLLCVSRDQEMLGAVELGVYPLDNHTEFQAILAELGVEPGVALPPDEAHAALSALAENYLAVIREDRQFTFPDDPFIPIGPEPVQVGQLPGMSVGFVHENSAGEVLERYLSYTAFDGHVIYWLTAPYDPANITTFVSDEALTEFEPYLREIVAGLLLPPPVVETDVEAVNVVASDVPLMAVYGQVPLGIAVGMDASQAEPYAVTGASADGRWWRVECSEALTGVCWLPADPQRVRPAAPPG